MNHQVQPAALCWPNRSPLLGVLVGLIFECSAWLKPMRSCKDLAKDTRRFQQPLQVVNLESKGL